MKTTIDEIASRICQAAGWMVCGCVMLVCLLLIVGCSQSQPDSPEDQHGIEIEAVIEKRAEKIEPVPPVPEKPQPKKLQPVPQHSAMVYTAEDVNGKGWCKPCRELHAKWGDGNDVLRIEWSTKPIPSGPEIYPAIRWTDSTGSVRYPADKHGRYIIPPTLDDLAEKIRRSNVTKIVDARVGAIPAKQKSVAAIAWFRANVGENVPASFRWYRTGLQRFRIYGGPQDPWTLESICGKWTRFELSAPGCKLPVDHATSEWEVTGNKVISTLKIEYDFGDGIAPKAARQDKVGFATELMTVFGVLRSLWNLWQTKIEIELGGNVSATAVLQGDTLAVDFQQGPSVTITSLVNVFVGVRRAEITAGGCRLLFNGSRLFREFTIPFSD